MTNFSMRALVAASMAFTLAGALMACGGSDGEGEGSEPAQVSESAASTDAGAVTTACPATRWISYASDGLSATAAIPKCRDPRTSPLGRWRVSNLFDPTTAAPSPYVPRGLNRFCAYDWVSTAGNPPDVAALPPQATSFRLAPDCMVASALGSLDDESVVWRALRNKALLQSGLNKSDLTPLPATTRSGKPVVPVRVAVLDSAPSTPFDGKAGKVGNFAHGHNVGRFIRELGCPRDGADTSTCIARVSNHLALPLLDERQEDRTNGGYFGRQSDVARALHEALRPPTAIAAGPGHVVINMSIGWDSDPTYGGAFTNATDLPPPALAVHQALVHAACRGALVFAAAGNATNGASATATTGAMYPAAWEAKRGPTDAECKAMEPPGFPIPAWITATPSAPLLYAVGGVDGRDAPLANSRPTGRPVLQAYGFQVVSADGVGQHTNAMTGTSMSTAATSAAAAVVWGYRPTYSPHQVVALLRATAVPLGSPADLCFTQPCARTRRVSLGAALLRAECDQPACAGETFSALVPAYAGTNPSWQVAWDTLAGGVPQMGEGKPCAGSEEPACVSPTATKKSKYATPWVKPQPGSTGCDVCGASDSHLWVSLDPLLVGNVSQAYLTIYGQGATTSYAIDVPAMQTFSVGNVAPPPGAYAATISFAVNNGSGGYSTQEPILYW